jgi:hypothetical protein
MDNLLENTYAESINLGSDYITNFMDSDQYDELSFEAKLFIAHILAERGQYLSKCSELSETY